LIRQIEVVLSNGTLLSNKSGSIKERTQMSTEMGSDQLAVTSLSCYDLTADWSLPIWVLVASGKGCAGTVHA